MKKQTAGRDILGDLAPKFAWSAFPIIKKVYEEE